MSTRSLRSSNGTLDDPVVIPFSSSRASSQQSVPDDSLSDDAGSPSELGDKQRRDTVAWTAADTFKVVEIIKQNPSFHSVLLKGHKKTADNRAVAEKISLNTYYRAIDRIGKLNRNPGQVRAKLIWIHAKYQAAISSMGVTGRGLLLSEMRSEAVKNAREQLLKQFPWFELYHDMMRDRASSDPAMLVTGNGEVHLSAMHEEEEALGEDGSDAGSINSSQVDELIGDDGQNGLNLLTQAALRAETRRINTSLDRVDGENTFTDSDDEDDAIMDDNTATPRARSTNTRPLASQSRTAIHDNFQSLPTLGHLASQTDLDPMLSGSSAATRNASPGALDPTGQWEGIGSIFFPLKAIGISLLPSDKGSRQGQGCRNRG